MPIKQLQLQCAVDNEITPHNQQTPNHVLHAILSLLVIGLWIPVWIVIAIGAGSEPATCVKCGNRRPVQGAAVILGKASDIKPTSAKQWIVAAAVIGAILLAVVVYGFASGDF